jgi:hypothetical protein
MTELRKGRIGWIDLTVDDADAVRDPAGAASALFQPAPG